MNTIPPAVPLPQTNTAAQAYQLYVELADVRPKVWRRLLVPFTVRLQQLHGMLLWGTGWDGGHLHEFIFGDTNYAAVEPLSELGHGVMDEENVSLRDALGRRQSFVYIYDYGDNWQHKFKVEKIVTLDTPILLAVCIAGANACPPEDVGGVPGYEEFLEALADPDHAEHEMLSKWIGGPFEPTAFDIDQVNQRLAVAED